MYGMLGKTYKKFNTFKLNPHQNLYQEYDEEIVNDHEKTQNEYYVCQICDKDDLKVIKRCSDCKMRFYCSKEHFEYDYHNFHFFECQLIQFFKRKDIICLRNDLFSSKMT